MSARAGLAVLIEAEAGLLNGSSREMPYRPAQRPQPRPTETRPGSGDPIAERLGEAFSTHPPEKVVSIQLAACRPSPGPVLNRLIRASRIAGVAQWQSNGFVNRRSSVQSRPPAPFRKPVFIGDLDSRQVSTMEPSPVSSSKNSPIEARPKSGHGFDGPDSLH